MDGKRASPHPWFHRQNFPGSLPMPWLLLLLASLSTSSTRWTEGSYHHHLWKLVTPSKDASHSKNKMTRRNLWSQPLLLNLLMYTADSQRCCFEAGFDTISFQKVAFSWFLLLKYTSVSLPQCVLILLIVMITLSALVKPDNNSTQGSITRVWRDHTDQKILKVGIWFSRWAWQILQVQAGMVQKYTTS